MKRAVGFSVVLGVLVAALVAFALLKPQKLGYEKLQLSPGVTLSTKVVPPLIIEGPDRTFTKPIVQYSSAKNKLVIASNESHLWPEELVKDWRASSRPDAELWARVPRPTHVWVANFETGSLEYGDTNTWEAGSPAILMHFIEDYVRERRLKLAEPMLTSKPAWWPDKEIAGLDGLRYGRVVPGRDALYYTMFGPKVRTESDFFGNNSIYGGPLRVVIQPKGTQQNRIYEYVLETDKEFTGFTVRFDEGGNYLLAYSEHYRRLWFVDLEGMWIESEIKAEPILGSD